VGDRWTLVVLRTIFAGATRYNELLGMSEGIATNILADRLAKLEQYGLIGKEAYQEGPTRYRYWLTEAGAELLPVLQALARWSTRHIPGRWDLPEWFARGTPASFIGPDPAGPRTER
jgi:DNA-binding HxlR family transcriptional regulator